MFSKSEGNGPLRARGKGPAPQTTSGLDKKDG